VNRSRVFTYSSFLFALSLCACGGGGIGGDGRAAAIQTAIDADPTYIDVPSGKQCHPDDYWKTTLPKFKGLKYVTVASAGEAPNFVFGTQPCYTVTWDKSLKVTHEIMGDDSKLPIGHFVVDKIGDEEPAPYGGPKITRYKAHFEWYPQGKDMLARHLAQEPAPRTDAIAAMHKDADGKWVAQLQF